MSSCLNIIIQWTHNFIHNNSTCFWLSIARRCDAIKVLFFWWMFIRWWQQKRESRENPSFYYVSIHEAAPLYQLEIFHFRISCLLWKLNEVRESITDSIIMFVHEASAPSLFCVLLSRGEKVFLGWVRERDFFHICTNETRLLSYTRLASSDFCGHCWERENINIEHLEIVNLTKSFWYNWKSFCREMFTPNHSSN